jgi:hypothetical protein
MIANMTTWYSSSFKGYIKKKVATKIGTKILVIKIYVRAKIGIESIVRVNKLRI